MLYGERRIAGERKVVLVTGCTGLLGSFFLDNFAHAYEIVGVARHRSEKTPAGIDFIEADLCRDIESIVRQVLKNHGKIDTLINNAAIGDDHTPLTEKQPQEMERALKINLIAPLELANAIFWNFWIQEGKQTNLERGRSVVNVSSVSGVHAYKGNRMYGVAKAGLNMLTKHMALEYPAYGIRVNAVAPRMVPQVVSLDAFWGKVVNLIEGVANGSIVVMEEGGDYELPFKVFV